MRAGIPCRGIKHREACRQRVEKHLGDANDPRIVAADERWTWRVVAQGGPSLAPQAEEGQERVELSGAEAAEADGLAGPATAGVRPSMTGAAGLAGPATAGVRPYGARHSAADGQPASVSVHNSAADGQPASVRASIPEGLGEQEDDDMADDESIAADPVLDAFLRAMPDKLEQDARACTTCSS